jgi:hypothetical protein
MATFVAQQRDGGCLRSDKPTSRLLGWFPGEYGLSEGSRLPHLWWQAA